MAETSLGSIPENLSITDVYTTATVNPLPAMLVGRRALYDELIWDAEGGFATAWQAKSSLVDAGDGYFYFKLQRQAFSAAGLALFVNGEATGGGGFAPTDASYVVLGATPDLDNERVLTAGTGISIVDSGPGLPVTINAEAGALLGVVNVNADYTLQAGDVNKLISVNTSVAITVTIPAGLYVAGSTFLFSRTGAGDVTVALGGGVGEIRIADLGTFVTSYKLDRINGISRMFCSATNVWYTDGDTRGGVWQHQKSSQISGSYTIVESEINGLILSNAAGPTNITVPSSATLNTRVGSVVTVLNQSATVGATITLVSGGTTVSGTLSIPIGAEARIVWTGVNTAYVATSSGGAPVGAQYLTLATDGTLPNERVLTAGAGISITDGGAGGAVTVAKLSPAVLISMGALTPDLTHAEKFLLMNSPGVVPVTLVADSVVAFPLGTVIQFGQNQTGSLTFTAGPGASVFSPAGTLAASNRIRSTVTATKTFANTWYLTGDLASTTSYVTMAATGAHSDERVLTAGAGISITDGGAGGAVTVAHLMSVVNRAASYTLALTDAQTTQYSTAAVTNTVTIPTNATVAFPVGTRIKFIQAGAGQVLLSPTGGVSLVSPRGLGTRYMWSSVTLTKTATDTWVLGDDATDKIGFASFSADFTLTLQDASFMRQGNSASTLTVTLPTNATVPFPIGAWVEFTQAGAGQIVLVGAGGVTLVNPSNTLPRTRETRSVIRAYYGGSDFWLISGDLHETTAYVTIGNTASLPNERALTAGAGISITDGGAGGAVTVALSGATHAATGTKSSQALAAATETTITFDGEPFDPNNNLDTTTGLYTVPAAGIYSVTAAANMPIAGGASYLLICINGGGVVPAPYAQAAAASPFTGLMITQLHSVTAGATFSVKALATNATSIIQVRFSVHRIS